MNWIEDIPVNCESRY